tara:strand:- start:271 stop:672 length:402 start_codon:yes stop_codon:yes gene_type:complete
MIHKTYRIDSGATRTSRDKLKLSSTNKKNHVSETGTNNNPNNFLSNSRISNYQEPNSIINRQFTMNSYTQDNSEQLYAIKPNNQLREDSSQRLAERALMLQTSQNPFYANSNYLNDIDTQDKFLKPCNSNFTT